MEAPSEEDVQRILAEWRKISEFLARTPALEKLRQEVQSKLGATPRDLIFHEHSVALYRYKRSSPPTVKTPLLLVYSLVNRPYILDLYEGQSLVQALLDRGFDVYLFDWGEPNRAQRHLPMSHYIRTYLGRAVRRVLRSAGAESLSLGGYCLGGVLSLLYAAVDGGRRVRNLVTIVTPVAFHDRGLLSWWAREEHFNVDAIVDAYGNVPADFFAGSFPWLAPMADLKKVRAMYAKQKDRAFLESLMALDIWINDNTSMPGQFYRELIRHGYQENVLVSQGAWPLGPIEARLSDVTIPLLNLTARFDHVSPVESCTCLQEMVPSRDKRTIEYETGHLGIALGKDKRGRHTESYWDDLAAWLADRDG